MAGFGFRRDQSDEGRAQHSQRIQSDVAKRLPIARLIVQKFFLGPGHALVEGYRRIPVSTLCTPSLLTGGYHHYTP